MWLSAQNSSASISFYGATTRLGRFTGNGLTLDTAALETTANLVMIPASGTRSSWIDFGTTGSNAPTNNVARSEGTKIVIGNLYSAGNGRADYAIGYNSSQSEMWLSAPLTTNLISFYGATTRVAYFAGGAGVALTLAGTLVGGASQDVFNTTSTTLNFAGAATALTIGATTGTATIRNAILNLSNASGQLQINSTKVVGTRETGYVAFTGTTNKGTSYATGTVTLIQLAERVAALQASLTTHGLIGT